jgi:hypothetical protein
MESFEDLARKMRILEQELEVQREALDKLKQMSTPRKQPDPVPVRSVKTA